MITYSFPAATFEVEGSPEAVREAGLAYGRFATTAGQASADLHGLDSGGWVGSEGDLFRARVAELPPPLDTAHGAFSQVARALDGFADALEGAQGGMAGVRADAEQTFSRLFPGGEGRLVLTEPTDMLATGVEVEARPPGKKVKRLSLLSGGERSLTAIALLVAIFRARPSPFYVLDEVEAALDDVNLRRLISLMGELRATSQLIVITHQKPTMEIADALYGVSMRGDGITTVISQRLRAAESAAS